MTTILFLIGVLAAFTLGYYFGSFDKKDPFFESLESWSLGDLSITSVMSPQDWFLCATQIDRSKPCGEQRAWVMREFALGRVVPIRPVTLAAFKSCSEALAGFCDADIPGATAARRARAGLRLAECCTSFVKS